MKRLLALALVAVFTTPLWAVKSADNARAAANRWGGHRQHFGGRVRAGVERVTRHSPADGDDFFAVKFAGGGTAFVAGDGEDELPIAFTTSTNDYSSIDKASPLWALLERDAKARKLGAVSRPSMALGDSKITSDSAISDMRVPPLVQSKWNQGGGIYNYYTPNNYVCGCVATAMSQVMRYHEYPTESRAQFTRKCWLNTVAAEHTSKGGTYEWADMPLVPSSTSETQKQAIGKLTYDAGVAVYMNWTSGGSGAFDFNVPNALAEGFGYQSAVFCSISKISTVLVSGIFANLEAGYPVVFGINDSSGYNGHCIVGDGYGYEGGLPYVHLNMGWSGQDDCWYNLPDIGTRYNFSVLGDMVGNIFPTNALGSVTVSGRVTDGESPRPNARVRISSSATGELVAEIPVNECGVWGAVVTGGVYSVQAVEEGTLPAAATAVTVSPQAVYRVTWGGYITSTYVENYTNIPQVTSFANRTGVDFVLVGENQVQCPTVDIPAGVIVGSANVTLACETEGAAIRYTLDGTNPTASSTLYVAPISINHACTLKARAFKDGMGDSPVLSVVYTWHRAPKTVIVAADGTGEFTSLSNAVWNAVDGDRFTVRPGVYHGYVEVPSDVRVTIASTDGPDVTIIDGDAEGCCFYGYYSTNSIISGFTLRNGNRHTGGGICGGIATNCVITGCVADYGGGASEATLYNCYLYGNVAYQSGGGAQMSELYHCTVYGNYTYGTGGGVECYCNCYDSIIWGNEAQNDERGNWETWTDSQSITTSTYMERCCSTPAGFIDGDGCITSDPQFCDAENGDLRLREGSPCLGAGSDGSNMGAYQGAGEPGHTITVAIVGNGHVSPMSVYVPAGGSATFTAFEDHPFVKFATNGVDVVSGASYTWPGVNDNGTLTAYFSATNFHVDAATGSDGNRGWDWSEPFATITAAAAVAGDGETIFVKPGVYTGCVEPKAGAAVSVVAVEGPDVTSIVGGDCSCFYAANSPSSSVIGFTLTNGWDNCGGGIWGGVASNCVIRDCGAMYGGGAAYADLYDCYVFDCMACDAVSGGYYYPAYGGGVYESDCRRCTIVTNAARGVWQYQYYYGFVPYGGGACYSTLRDCILSDNVLYYQDNEATVLSQVYNCSETNDFTGDARFVDFNGRDFRLYLSSPCIRAASDGVHNQGAYQGPGVVPRGMAVIIR